LFYVRLVPGSGPAGPVMPWRERLVVVRQSWGVVFLAVVVSGGIYGGIFTVVEAASVGACIAFLFAFMRVKLKRTVFWQVLREAAINTGLIYMIIMGAHLLTNFVTLTNIAEDLVAMIKSLEYSP